MRLISILLCVAFCTLMGCKKEDVSNSNPSPKADYVITVGSTFQVNLTANPTTGYSWKWANQESVAVVESTGHTFTSDHPGMMGSSGTDTWTFIGKSTGSDAVKLIYTRGNGASDNPTSKTITVQVN